MRKTDPEYAAKTEFWNAGHFNENRAVGVAIKTTGPDSKIHELLQICVFPLTSKFELSKETIPFDMIIKPIKSKKDFDPAKSGFNKAKFDEILTISKDSPQIVAELFDRWMEDKIKLRFQKKLLPVAYNWAYMRPFIKNWLGPVTFDQYFSHEYRDLMSIALYCNDYADINILDIIYSKVSLSYIASTLKIEYHRNNEAILIVKTVCESYRALMKRFLPKDA